MELPASFIDYTRALLGDEEYDKLAVALQQEPPVSIRLNQLKINHLELMIIGLSSIDSIWRSVSLSRSIPYSMQAVIMFRKLLPCLWSRYSGNISRDR